MYENCIMFMRRSVTADDVMHQTHVDKDQKALKEQERLNRREARRDRAEAKAALRSDSRKTPADILKSARADSTASIATARPSRAPLAVKTGPRDSKAAKRDSDRCDKALFTDAAQTYRRTLKADAVAIVNIDEYQLFIRRSSGSEPDSKTKDNQSETKEAIIGSFLQGKRWPADIEPVVHHVPRSHEPGVTVFGTDTASDTYAFHFEKEGTERTMSDFLGTYLKTRHFWWDREDSEDDLSKRIMDLMPDEAQTVLGTAFMTYEGKPRFAMFAAWNRPPSEFGDSHNIALPFAHNLGSCTLAALAVRKVRTLEMSQISYSNLQAQ
jgi:hypothetical protein